MLPSPIDDRRRLPSSGLDAFDPKRRVLPAATGALRLPAGTCPGCGTASHPRLTCDGATTAQVVAFLWPGVRLPAAERRARL